MEVENFIAVSANTCVLFKGATTLRSVVVLVCWKNVAKTSAECELKFEVMALV